jgi:CheY-like chemotaxis protein
MQRVLLADDSVAARKSIRQALEAAGIEVTAVADGDSALARIDEAAPQVVLLDVGMPGRGGYEICEAIRARPELDALPVILLTSDFEPYDEDEAARVRADGHLVKPFDARAVSAMRVIWERVGRPSGASPEPEPPSLVPAPEYSPRDESEDRDGSSTDGIDAYSTVTIPAVQFAPSLPAEAPSSGTMVVGMDGIGVGAWEPAPDRPAAPLPPLPPLPPQEPEPRPPAAEPRRRRTAPLPDIAIDSLDEEDPSTWAPETAPSAPTTENLDTGLVEGAAEIVRSAAEAGIRSVGSGELRLALGRCPDCQAAITPGDIFCLACGAAVLSDADGPDASGPPACLACGHVYLAGDVFCAACGGAL